MRVVGNIASDSEVVATADGAITAGKPVVVNADGTVKFAGPTSTTISAGIGSEVTFESAAARPRHGTFDSNSNKVVVTYTDNGNSGYGTAIIGTIDDSDNSISFGTAVVFESAYTDGIAAVFDSSNNKVVIAYRDGGNSYYGTAIVGTVSGTSISFGSATTFWANANMGDHIAASFDTNVNKVLITFPKVGNDGVAIAGTVSGTSISFGSDVTFETGQATNQSVAFDSSNNVHVVTYMDGANSQYGTACVLSVASNSAITAQTPVVWESAETQKMDIAFDTTNNKFLIAFRQVGSSSRGTGIVGTVSGTSLSFGTKNDWNSVTTQTPALAFNDASGTFVILYDESSGTDVKYIEATISGTSVTFGTAAVADTDGSTDYNDVIFDSNLKRTVLLYEDSGASQYGKARVLASAATYNVNSLTSENFIGFAKDNVADGAVATIQTANSIARDNIGEPITLSGGTAAVFESANTTLLASTFDSSNNKIVIAYRDNGNSEYGTAIVGTVSGTDITFGSPTVFESASIGFMGEDSIVFDSNANKVVIVYEDEGNSQYGTAIVGTVSGTSISFGSPTVFESAACFDISAAFDSSNNKVVVAYEDQGNSEHGTAIVGTVSGTSISFGSPTVFNAGETLNIETTFDSTNNKVVIAFTDAGNSNQGTAIVGTVSGTSISFGSEAVFDTSTGSKVGQGKSSITFDSNQNKVLVSYVDVGDSEHGKAIVGTVSGTSISFGTASTFESATTSELSSAFDSDAKVVVIAYKDEGNSSYGTAVTASISGTSVSFTSPVVYKTSRADEVSITYDSSNNKTVAAFGDVGNSEYGTAVVISADSSLTIGQQYFVQTDGTLSTSADSPSVIAGTAISGTDLIVKG